MKCFFSSSLLCSHMSVITQTLSHPTFLILRLFFSCFPTYYLRRDASCRAELWGSELHQAAAEGGGAQIGCWWSAQRNGGEGERWRSRPAKYRSKQDYVNVFVQLNIQLFTMHRCKIQRPKGTNVTAVNSGTYGADYLMVTLAATWESCCQLGRGR